MRKPIGWSTIIIAVLVAVSAGMVWRRDGTEGVLEILTHDLSLFSGILPRVLAGCLLGAFISEILPHEKVSRSLGPKSGLMGLLIGAAFGAILPIEIGVANIPLTIRFVQHHTRPRAFTVEEFGCVDEDRRVDVPHEHAG